MCIRDRLIVVCLRLFDKNVIAFPVYSTSDLEIVLLDCVKFAKFLKAEYFF